MTDHVSFNTNLITIDWNVFWIMFLLCKYRLIHSNSIHMVWRNQWNRNRKPFNNFIMIKRGTIHRQKMDKLMNGVLWSESKQRTLKENNRRLWILKSSWSNNTVKNCWKHNRREIYRNSLTRWPVKMNIITCRKISSWKLL